MLSSSVTVTPLMISLRGQGAGWPWGSATPGRCCHLQGMAWLSPGPRTLREHPPKIPHNTRTPQTHGHLQKGFGSGTSPSRTPNGHPHPQTSLLLRSRPSHPLGVLNMGTGTTHRGRTHSLLPHHRDVHAVGGGHSCERDPAGEQRGSSLQERGRHQHGGQDDTKPLGAGGEGNRPVPGMGVLIGKGAWRRAPSPFPTYLGVEVEPHRSGQGRTGGRDVGHSDLPGWRFAKKGEKIKIKIKTKKPPTLTP